MLSNQAKQVGTARDLDREVENICRHKEAHFILVIIADDTWYSQVKYHADKRGIITQCIRLQKLEKLPGMNIFVLIYYSYVQSTIVMINFRWLH